MQKSFLKDLNIFKQIHSSHFKESIQPSNLFFNKESIVEEEAEGDSL